MTVPPTINMVGWSITDFELAFDGVRQVAEAAKGLCNQPRATLDLEYLPGARFIAHIGEDWCGHRIDEILDRLTAIRFDDPKDDERRVLLLVNYYSSHGPASEPLSKIVALALDQSVRPAA